MTTLEEKVQFIWGSNAAQDRYRSLKLLRTILTNVTQNPTEKKFQKLKTSAIRPKLPAAGAVELLLAAGFVEGPTHFTASGDSPATQAQLVLDALDAEERRRKSGELKEREDVVNQLANENKKRKIEAEKAAAKDKEDVAKRLQYFKDKSDQAKKRLPGAIEEEIAAAAAAEAAAKKAAEEAPGGKTDPDAAPTSTPTPSTTNSTTPSTTDSTTPSTTDSTTPSTSTAMDTDAQLAAALALSDEKDTEMAGGDKATNEMDEEELDGAMKAIIEDLKIRKSKEKDSDKETTKKEGPPEKKVSEMTKEEKMEWVEKRRQEVRQKREKEKMVSEKDREKSRKEQAKAAMALKEKIEQSHIQSAVVAKKKQEEDKRKALKKTREKIKAEKERRKTEREKEQAALGSKK